ncbi:hypothetical protein AUJ65_00055 [Candidatus Micrarchaeota archaeon CG1_02_51_15]|nr:MAG: hypothetical protein AUJ65_00055 [Candidatus Micrarchaeota archaeon CG1_02_51_15]
MFFEALSFACSFFITFAILLQPRSFLVLAALAIALYFLFGPFGVPGFIMAVAVKLALPERRKLKKGERRPKDFVPRGGKSLFMGK